MGYELTETLYEPVEKDGTTVKEGDPRARFLVGVPGQTISDEEAARLGLGQGKPEHKAVQADGPDVANKAVQMGGDGPRGKGH